MRRMTKAAVGAREGSHGVLVMEFSSLAEQYHQIRALSIKMCYFRIFSSIFQQILVEKCQLIAKSRSFDKNIYYVQEAA